MGSLCLETKFAHLGLNVLPDWSRATRGERERQQLEKKSVPNKYREGLLEYFR
jgi:hypothetical protein